MKPTKKSRPEKTSTQEVWTKRASLRETSIKGTWDKKTSAKGRWAIIIGTKKTCIVKFCALFLGLFLINGRTSGTNLTDQKNLLLQDYHSIQGRAFDQGTRRLLLPETLTTAELLERSELLVLSEGLEHPRLSVLSELLERSKRSKLSKLSELVSGGHRTWSNAVEGEKEIISRGEESSNTFSDYYGISYSPKKHTYFSLNLGRPFLMPNMEDLFLSNLNCMEAKDDDTDPEPEYGWNFDLNLQGCALNHKFKYEITLFYNTVEEFVNETPLNDPGEDFSLKITDPELMGGVCYLSYRFDSFASSHHSFFIGTGVSYLYGIDRSGEKETPLFDRAPFKLKTNLTSKSIINKKWLTAYSLSLEHDYMKGQNSLVQNTFNLVLELHSDTLPCLPSVSLIMSNIFNTYHSSSYAYSSSFDTYNTSLGRNIKILVSLTL